jgi:hypothetical protein
MLKILYPIIVITLILIVIVFKLCFWSKNYSCLKSLVDRINDCEGLLTSKLKVIIQKKNYFDFKATVFNYSNNNKKLF